MLLFLIARPPVILLDEPLTSFDVVVALEIKNLLRQIKHDHVIVFSTHILQLATDPVTKSSFCMTASSARWTMRFLQSKDFEEQIIELLTEQDAPAEKKEGAPMVDMLVKQLK